MNFEALGTNVIVVLKKQKDNNNGEHELENGLIAIGSSIDKNAKNEEFDKFIGEVISVGEGVTTIKPGDVVRTKQFEGDILRDYESDTEYLRTIVFDVKDILAKVK